MILTEPITFRPLFFERVWGGDRLRSYFGKDLPGDTPIGESWELVDREEAQSVVLGGPFQGKTLHELWAEHRPEVFGSDGLPDTPRFPLLFKILDAQKKLSIQVHPPASVAGELNGEPKTEMWYIVATGKDRDIYAGLKRGANRGLFEKALSEGTVDQQVHRIVVDAGDALFIPSGRVHAIGAGNLIIEVQQNSDTTYRVFDWNRLGLDGKPRDLHIEESLRSIDFDDIEPGTVEPEGETLASCEFFRVDRMEVAEPRPAVEQGRFAVFACLSGAVSISSVQFKPGEFFLVPATLEERTLRPVEKDTVVLRATIPAPGTGPGSS